MLKSTATRIMLYVVLAWFLSADYSLVTHYGHLSPVVGALVGVVLAIFSPAVLVGVMNARQTKFKLLLEPAAMIVVVAAYLGFYSKFNAWESLVAGSFAVGGFLIALAEERNKAKEKAERFQSNLEALRQKAFREVARKEGRLEAITDDEWVAARLSDDLDSHPVVAKFLADHRAEQARKR